MVTTVSISWSPALHSASSKVEFRLAVVTIVSICLSFARSSWSRDFYWYSSVSFSSYSTSLILAYSSSSPRNRFRALRSRSSPSIEKESDSRGLTIALKSGRTYDIFLIRWNAFIGEPRSSAKNSSIFKYMNFKYAVFLQNIHECIFHAGKIALRYNSDSYNKFKL